MRARRAQGDGPLLVRPLLDVPRALLDDYARAHALAWIEDESNADARFRRNYLRHEVMPRLRAVFPQAERSLARASAHFAEGAQLLDELAAIDRAALANASGRLCLAGFNALAAEKPARARNLLRFVWLAAGFRAPDTRWIDEALRQLASAAAPVQICVSTVDGALHVYRGEIHVAAHAGVPDVPRRWSGESELPWAGGRLRFVGVRGAGLARRALLAGEVRIAARQGGERLQPDARRPRRSLRNLLQEAALPPWERRRLPLLSIDGTLAWVGAIGVDARFACAADEDGVLPVWESDGAPPVGFVSPPV
jgi:tRNA(Ile)-lysidine synthase